MIGAMNNADFDLGLEDFLHVVNTPPEGAVARPTPTEVQVSLGADEFSLDDIQFETKPAGAGLGPEGDDELVDGDSGISMGSRSGAPSPQSNKSGML